jgi:fructose-1,6-bisphosphatase/sedoheptulose 1,7-bisphosphatase-like protein
MGGMTELVISIAALIVALGGAFFAGVSARRDKKAKREIMARLEKDAIKRKMTHDETVDALTRPSDRR